MNVLTSKPRPLTIEECAEVWHFVKDCVASHVADTGYPDQSNYEPLIQEWFGEWFEARNDHPDDRIDQRMDEAWEWFCEEVGKP